MNVRTDTGNSHDLPSRYGCPHCGNKLNIPVRVPYMGTCGKCKKIWKGANVIKLKEDD